MIKIIISCGSIGKYQLIYLLENLGEESRAKLFYPSPPDPTTLLPHKFCLTGQGYVKVIAKEIYLSFKCWICSTAYSQITVGSSLLVSQG